MGKGGKGTSGNCGNKSAKGKGDEEDEVTNVRNYHWRPNDTPEIGGWLHQQVATKGSGKCHVAEVQVEPSYVVNTAAPRKVIHSVLYQERAWH